MLGNETSITYKAKNLAQGLNYYFRVSAWNGVANIYGNFKSCTPAIIQPVSNPLIVSDITITPISDSSVKVNWKVPTANGGSDLNIYSVDYDYKPLVNEIQQVTITSKSMKVTGTFCLAFDGISTSSIPYSASAIRLESALESLSNIGNVQVKQDFQEDISSNSYQIQWSITFLDNVGNLPLLTVGCNYLSGNSVSISITEVTAGLIPAFNSGSIGIFQRPLGNLIVKKTQSTQIITVNSSSVDLNGYFYIYNSGEISLPIDVYPTADDMQYLLESMLTIDKVDVTVVNHTLETSTRLENYGRSWIVTFYDSHDQSLLVSTGGKYSTSAAGGTLLGSNVLAYVERIFSDKLSNFVEIKLFPSK